MRRRLKSSKNTLVQKFKEIEVSLLQHRAYNRLYLKDKMTVGFAIPTARMSKYPTMENQLSLARKIEDHGFAALWLRDVTIQNLNIDENGQMYELIWSILQPIPRILHLGRLVRSPSGHPVRVAKEASSIDRSFPERLIMGVASWDREKDFTALGKSNLESGGLFKKIMHSLNGC